MIKSFVYTLEDPKRPLLAPNYWLLFIVALILPKNKIVIAIRIFMHGLGGFFVLSQYIELYVTRSDIDQVLTNLKISMLSTVCIAKAYTFVYWQKKWLQIFEYVTAADIYERDNQDGIRAKILDKYTKYCRRVTYFYWGLLFTTFSTTNGTPLMRYMTSQTYREELRNGTELFPHIFSSWMPFNKYSSPGCWITVVWHILLCAYGASIVAAFDANVMVMLVFFGGKLDLMQERCKIMLGTDGRGISDYEAGRVIRDMHLMHIAHMNEKMIKSFVYTLEDPKRPLLAPNYWLLFIVALILPKNKIVIAIRIFMHGLGGFFVLSQYIELYVTRSDIDQVLTNLKISMLSTVCIAKAYTFVYWQKKWLQIFEYVTAADIYERDNQDGIRAKILDKYTKYCRRVTYFYWGLLFTTFSTTNGTPLMRYMTSQTYREELRNGTELFPHIFSSWMPFNKYSSPGCWITVVWHILLCAYGASIVAAFDANVMVMLVFFGGKLDLMQERCKIMLGTDGRGISDYEAGRVIRDMHLMHIAHMKHMKLLNSVLSPVMFVYVVMCSLMLCASMYQLTSSNNALQKLLLAEYLMFGIAELFIFCWHSNNVLIKNERLTQGIFESQWWAATSRQRKSILLLMGQMDQSHIFTAGPFTNLTLATFVTILKGAYSYYTLLRK